MNLINGVGKYEDDVNYTYNECLLCSSIILDGECCYCSGKNLDYWITVL